MPIRERSIGYHDFIRLFPDQSSCLTHLFNVRFGQDYPCPKCLRHTRWVPYNVLPVYGCKRCGYHLRPTSGTIFSNSKLPLTTWFQVIWLMTLSRHGLSAMFAQRYFGCSGEAAWRMLSLIRSHIADLSDEAVLGGPGVVVEVDETLLRSVRDKDTQRRRRALIFGITDRNRVLTKVIPSRRQRTLLKLIKRYVAPGSIIHTDGWRGYEKISELGYEHRSVNHKKAEWISKDGTSTLYIDNYWAYLKRFIRGTHLHVGEAYLNGYLKECEHRFNYRKQPAEMFWSLISNFPPLPEFRGVLRPAQRRSRSGGNMTGELIVPPPSLAQQSAAEFARARGRPSKGEGPDEI